jgi:hypothetical protein
MVSAALQMPVRNAEKSNSAYLDGNIAAASFGLTLFLNHPVHQPKV